MARWEDEEVTGRILQCAFRVQNTLGCGFLEKVYENAMGVALRKEGLEVVQQMPIRVHYEDVLVGEHVADIIVARCGLVEVKAAEGEPKVFSARVLNCLKATGLPVGMLLNFASLSSSIGGTRYGRTGHGRRRSDLNPLHPLNPW